MTGGLLRLMSWLSPVFPTGGFAYSAGLERAVADGLVRDEAGLKDWLSGLLAHGSPWNDAVLMAESHRAAADHARLQDIAELAEALCGSAERHGEAMRQGRSFLDAASGWFEPGTLPSSAMPLAVAVGAAAGQAAIDRETSMASTTTASLRSTSTVRAGRARPARTGFRHRSAGAGRAAQDSVPAVC